MNKHTTDIVAYLTWVGLLISFVMGDRNASRFHINQSLVIWLTSTLCGVAIKLVGWLLSFVLWLVEVFCAVCWFIGFIGAIQGTEKPLPVLGQIRLL